MESLLTTNLNISFFPGEQSKLSQSLKGSLVRWRQSEPTTIRKSALRNTVPRCTGRSLRVCVNASQDTTTSTASVANCLPTPEDVGIGGLHHVGLLCENIERSLEFYCGLLGLELNHDRANANLPYKGAWLWVGREMIHLMELPNPDPTDGRPAHGGRDRHACFTIRSVESLKTRLDSAGVSFTASKSGRPALFTRDPDGNALEFSEIPKRNSEVRGSLSNELNS